MFLTHSQLEPFVADLWENKFIRKSHKAKTNGVRLFYGRKYQKNLKMNFDDFLNELWLSYIVKFYNDVFIYFDYHWLHYIKKNSRDSNHAIGKYFFVHGDLCRLCLFKSTRSLDCTEHAETMEHIARVNYLRKSKEFFTDSKDLRLTIHQNNKKMHKTNSLYVSCEPRKELSTTLYLRNASSTDYYLLNIFKLNLYNTDVTLEVPPTKENSLAPINVVELFGTEVTFDMPIMKMLRPNEVMELKMNAYFHAGETFVFPIVIVALDPQTQGRMYFLREIKFDVKSRYAHLESGLPYKPVTLKLHEEYPDFIIRSVKKQRVYTYYEEKKVLKQYNIPLAFQEALASVYSKYLDRGKRYNKQIHLQISKVLKIDPYFHESNYISALRAILHIEEFQTKNDMRYYDTFAKIEHVEGDTYKLKAAGLSNSRPSLLVGDSVYLKSSNTNFYKYQGTVYETCQNSVVVGFSAEFTLYHRYGNTKRYFVEFSHNRRPHRVANQALEILGSHDAVSYFFPKTKMIQAAEEDKDQSQQSVNFFNENLNEEQKQAVYCILKPKSVPYIIYGPPGTGKTLTLVEAILQVWKTMPNSRIIVCAPSNAATNVIALRLSEKVPNGEILRFFGNTNQEKHHINYLRKFSNYDEDVGFYMPSMHELLHYRILLTTLVTSARLVNGGVPEGHFSHVFIDEAGYATEADTLVPIAGILSSKSKKGQICGQVVLAGDPHQLGPVVNSNFARHAGLGRSMLERLLNCMSHTNSRPSSNHSYVTKLVKNYRSHEMILEVSNSLFYDSELTAENKDEATIFSKWEKLKTENFPVIFHNVCGIAKREENCPSYFNIQEVDVVMHYVLDLVGKTINNRKICQSDIGIITLYKKQANMIRKACTQEQYNEILVGSVEQFQGKEKLIIIISTVRSSGYNNFVNLNFKKTKETYNIGFLRNPKRFNVALTRAKALLIVVGNGNFLNHNKYWNKFIMHCQKHHSVYGKELES